MLARLVPGPLVRWFARPYVAGYSMQDGLDVADRLRESGDRITLDVLGEDVRTQVQVDASVGIYERLIDTLADEPRFADRVMRPTISLKPSAFTCGAHALARGPIEALSERAHAKGVALTIDMEDHEWTDLTLDWSIALFEKGRDVGTVLQSRLNRTEADLERIPAGMRLRLVIGIYPESAEIAVNSKRVMKERMVAYAARLLERGAFVEFASHDVKFTSRFVQEVAPAAPDRCEVQMLLGVPRGEFRKRLRSGALGPKLPFRLYVPFAMTRNDATAYLRRRMAESPGLAWVVFRNLFSTSSADGR